MLERLPVAFPAPNAGLRSRVWEARLGGLKWGRAAADLLLETGLRAAVRGACGSADLRGWTEDGVTGFGASTTGASSWSRECWKYEEAGREELV